MEEHQKYYRSKSEYMEKQKIFQDNQLLIEKLNEEQQILGSDVEFALNQFADMTPEEFRRKVLMPKQEPVGVTCC